MIDNISIREMQPWDTKLGLLDVLANLSPTCSQDRAHSIFVQRQQCYPRLKTFVAFDHSANLVVGTASIIIEPKFLHGGRPVAHIEDVAVLRRYRSAGLGSLLIHRCIKEARSRNCYKIILDCTDEVRPFYEKIGFHCHGNQMRHDL